MIKAVIFDLDDTLIPEKQYVKSGFKNVAEYVNKAYSINDKKVYEYMIETFEINRKNVFNRLFEHYKIGYSTKDIQQLVEIYRNHTPDILFYKDASQILKILSDMNIKTGIISDGYLATQQKKIDVLNIKAIVDYIILTDKLGREFWKPHPRAFELMAEKLNIEFEEMIYVGDNPNKDFYIKHLYPITTIRIKRKDTIYLNDKYRNNIKPDFEIGNLTKIKDIIQRLN